MSRIIRGIRQVNTMRKKVEECLMFISRERRYSRRQILRRPVMYRWAPYAKTKILTGTAPLEEV